LSEEFSGEELSERKTIRAQNSPAKNHPVEESSGEECSASEKKKWSEEFSANPFFRVQEAEKCRKIYPRMKFFEQNFESKLHLKVKRLMWSYMENSANSIFYSILINKFHHRKNNCTFVWQN
jgi:hypothetical protein